MLDWRLNMKERVKASIKNIKNNYEKNLGNWRSVAADLISLSNDFLYLKANYKIELAKRGKDSNLSEREAIKRISGYTSISSLIKELSKSIPNCKETNLWRIKIGGETYLKIKSLEPSQIKSRKKIKEELKECSFKNPEALEIANKILFSERTSLIFSPKMKKQIIEDIKSNSLGLKEIKELWYRELNSYKKTKLKKSKSTIPHITSLKNIDDITNNIFGKFSHDEINQLILKLQNYQKKPN